MTHHIDTKALKWITAFLGTLVVILSMSNVAFRIPWRIEALEQQHIELVKVVESIAHRQASLDANLAAQAEWRNQIIGVLTDIKLAIRDLEQMHLIRNQPQSP